MTDVATLAVHAGRMRLTWAIRPVGQTSFPEWRINAQGMPKLELFWSLRRRHVASLWVNADFGRDDQRPARIAFRDGPLEEHGIRWCTTWHTWSASGLGGENASDGDLATALESTLVALLRQGWIPGLRAGEVGQLFASAALLAGEWLASRGLCSIRWA